MKTNLSLMCVIVLCASLRGVAMPTEAEVEKAVPKVERMLASEKVALESGKMTRAEVAAAAMKLAAGADDEAAKLLLMKGAFILHVKDGDLEKAVKTMNALETAIADMPPQVVTNIIETALLGLPKKATSGARLYRLLDEGKRKESNPDNSSAAPQVVKAAMKASEGQEIVDGYTWSYAIRNGGASIEAPRGKYGCAVSPNPDGSVVIPAKLGGVNVTRIGRQAFARCRSLTSVTIPPTVTSIGMSAFYECRFDSVEIPPSVKEIESLAFYNNRCLKSVEVPEGVTSIGDEAFGFCADLESVVLPSTLVNIGRGVFACGGKRLRSIFVSPKNPKYAMYNDLLCTKDGRRVLASVGGDVVIPEGVVNIDDKAFLQCSGLTSVSISASVERISDSAFEWCEGIESFSVSPDNGMYSSPNGLLCSKDGKTLIAGVNGYVRIPEGVTDIEKWAFAGRRWLTTVTIPSSVKRIGDETFRCCRALESVTMDGEKPSAKRGLFDYCEKLKVIHVPAGAKSWAGMNEWLGVPLVFDAGSQGQGAQAAKDAERQARLEQEKVQREAARAEQREQLLAIQDELARVRQAKATAVSSPAVRNAVESILKGLVKVPGRDFWLSATELTQEQWEPIMEFNLSEHKGAKLPVDMVSRDDCDVFLEKLNNTVEVQASQFVFSLPKWEEWVYAAQAGSGMADVCWIKPGVAGNVLDMAWVKENSSNQTHEVATKASNAFGLYDMKGNVWEWLLDDSEKEMGRRRGHSFCEESEKCTLHNWITSPRNRRSGHCGLRLAAHIRPAPRPLMRPRRPLGLRSRQESQRNITLDGYTWLYSIKNGEATIETENRNRSSCAVLPKPTGNLTIPSTLGGAKVTGIGREAFKDCTELETVTIPDGVANIGDWAFRDCGKLKSLSLPSSLTNIEASAFRLCKGLTSVTIPQNVTSIGAAAFTECSGLKRIEVAAGNPRYVSIDGVLYTKDLKEVVLCPGALTSVVLPESVTSIGPCAFEACEELASVTMPECVTNIGPYAFKRCVKLTSLAIPKCVTSIGKDAFIECHGLTSLTLPEGLTRIGWAAFAHCDGLKSLTIPANVTTIEGAAFSHCTLLESMVIPAGVKSIEGWTFDCCERLSSVKIPEGVAKIGENAFKGCGALTSVTIPDGVTSIEKGAFNGCARLESVSISSNVKTIGAWAFQRCDGLTSVTLPEGVTRIGQGAFYECRNLASANLPQGLESIAGNAFMLCQELAPMTIPPSVTNIGGAAFAYCGQMKHIDVADENRSFTSIDGVVYTKDRTELVAFPSGKTSVTIPESVTIIRDGSFTSGSLTSVTIPPTVRTIGAWAFSGSGLTSVSLPPELTCIDVATFWGCHNLTSVTIPEGVTEIKNNAFRWCGKLTTITLPKSVRTVERETFYECGGLMSVSLRMSSPPVIQNNAFKGCGRLAEIRVPSDSMRWSKFKSAGKTVQGIPIVLDPALK